MPLPSVTTIRLRLILLVALGALLFSGVTVFRAVMERNRKVQELQNATARMAKGSAEDVSHLLENAQHLLLSLASNESVINMDGPAASALFADKLKQSKAYLNLGIVQPDGLIVGSALPREGSAYIADRTYAARLQKKRDLAVSEYLLEEINGKPTIKLGFPLPMRPGTIPPGVVYASLDLGVLHDSIAAANLPANAVILVTDRQGIYVARHPDLDNWVGTKARSWELMEAKGDERTGFIESTGADLIPRTYYNMPVPGSDGGLFVAVGVSNAAILAECKTALVRQLFWIGFCTALALVAVWFLGSLYHSLLKRVRRKPEPTRKVAQEEVSPRPEFKNAVQELPPPTEPSLQIVAAEALPAVPSVFSEEEELLQSAEPTRRVAAEDLIAASPVVDRAEKELPQPTEPPQRLAAEDLIVAPPMQAPQKMNTRLPMNIIPNPNDGTPELHQLEQSFETMSTVLRDHNERLERAVREQAAAVTAVDEAWEQEIARHRQAEIALKGKRIEQEQVIRQLQEALDRVKSISGLLPMSSESRKLRDDKGRWDPQAAAHPGVQNGAQSSNGFGADAARKAAPDLKIDRPPAPAKLNGFDATGPLYFADLKIEVPPTPSKPL